MLIGGVFVVAKKYFGEERDKAVYKELEDDFVTYDDKSAENKWNIQWSTSDSAASGSASSWYKKCQVNFEGLNRRNEEVVAWIFFENEDISYPIMYSEDDKYLNTTIDGASSTSGALFVDEKNEPDFEDKVTVVYGHNMRNGSMFGKLKNYKEEDYYQDHQYFQVLTEDGKAYRYRIFSYFDIDEYDMQMVDTDFYDSEDPESAITEVTEVDMTSTWKKQGLTEEEIAQMEPETETIIVNKDNTFEKYLELIGKSNRLANDIEVTKDDKIACLLTCSTSKGNRLLVYGLRVAEHDFNEIKDEKTTKVQLLDR